MGFLNRSAGRLSRHRRRPVAGLLLLMLGLVLTGSLYAAFAPSSTADSAKSDQELADEGRKLFLVELLDLPRPERRGHPHARTATSSARPWWVSVPPRPTSS